MCPIPHAYTTSSPTAVRLPTSSPTMPSCSSTPATPACPRWRASGSASANARRPAPWPAKPAWRWNSSTVLTTPCRMTPWPRWWTRTCDWWASDASFYRLVPEAVAHARTADEVRGLFAVSRAHGVPLVFRSAGTSLSGQSITDGILVETARGFRDLTVEGNGARIRVQPGVIGAHANRALRPFGRKIGPDPASIATCTIGGIIANNASGMCCGVAQNAYHTLESLTFLLPSGTAIDTARPDADEVFRAKEPALWQGLAELHARLVADAALFARIRAKYRTKNTTGYSLNAFLDWERPVDVFAHLLVGSEGTLAFVSEAVLGTVPDLPVKVTGLLLFPDLHAACAAIVPLNSAGAKALEVMDRA